MAYSTALDGPGILSLERVQLFFKKMRLPLSKVIIKQDYFWLYDEYDPDNQRFLDFVNQTKLCPVIAAEDIASGDCHAMVVDKAIQHGSEWYFQCKNTDKTNPQVCVAHMSTGLQFLQYIPGDAAIISFDRNP